MSYGHKIPVGVDVHINTIAYPVEVPEYAMPKSNVFELGELAHFNIPEKHTVVFSRITIAMMIDYCYRVIPFKIINSKDIIEIYSYVQLYIRQLNEYSDITEAAEYLAKARRFHEILYRSMVILSKTYPEAKPYVQSESLLNLFGGMDDITNRTS